MRIFLVVLMMVATLFAKESITKDEVSLSYWEAKKGDSTLYLFGTMHAKDRRVKSAFEQIKPLINRVDGVYTELALTPLASMIAFKKSIRDDNKTLKEILPPALYKELDSYLKSIHPLLSPKNFDRLKIWVVTTSLEMIKDELYYKDIEPLDKMIFNYGFRLKKE
ncbi:MAG: TraB/GumN family protein, partial [Epsilonproteobacteria bacterium]|nr:TraB/GumN family protein [Campylobacterota bacterium]